MAGKKTGKRLLTWVLVLVMALSLLPLNALAALNTGHKIDVRFTVLYVGDEFNIGYNYGTSEKTQFVCQYTTNHSDTAYNNHTIAISDIKAAADRASVNSGYQIVGWSKESNANPTVWPLNKSGTTACNKGTTIYLVAKNPNPTPTMYTYHLIHEFNYAGGTRWDITATTAAESYQLDVNNGKPTRNGYSFAGWAEKATAAAAKYFGGEQITLTKDNPTKTIYAVWMPVFELRYDANDGTGAPDSQTRTASAPTVNKVTFTVPNQTPTKADYTFKGWADSATATNAQYRPGDTIDVQHTDSPKTVYAVWEKSDSPTPDKPVPPSDGDLKSAIGKIQVTDVSTSSCGTKNYDLIANTQSEPFNWTKTARLDQPGKYDVTIKTAPYVAKYNSEIAKAHELNDASQTTLKLVISYKNSKWVLDDGKTEIKVKHTESTPAETPPEAPTADELKKLEMAEMAVLVKCDVDDAQQHTEAYGLLGEYNEDYIVGAPKKDGDDWLCEISYDPDLYVAEFNTAFPNLKHVRNDEKIVPVTLIWADGSWQLKTQGSVHVTEEYTVTFNAYGGFPTPDEQHVKSGEKAVLPAEPTLKGHTFAFWYLGDDEENATAYDFDTPVTGDITLTAKWNINKYTVTFNSYGGTPVPPAQEVEYGLTATEPATAPTKTGYTFDGWYLGDEKYDFSDAVEQNITLYANWEKNIYTVTYTDGVDGEEVFADQTYRVPFEDTTPAFKGTKTRAGYVFAGWKPEVAEKVTENATYAAQWKEDKNHNGIPDENDDKYTVTYTDGVNNEEVFADQVYGDLLSGTATPAFKGNPTRDGYVFDGWKPAFSDTVTGNVTYVAQWTARTDLSYTVHYYLKNTTKQVANDKMVAGQTFNADVTENAIRISGYRVYGDSVKSITIGTGTNEIIFYYTRAYHPSTPSKPTLNTGDHYAYVMGYPDGTVRPNGSITRAEVSAILFRLLSDETRDEYFTTESSFTDVKAGAWYNNSIATLEKAGVIVDTAKGGAFRPNEAITRAELAAMLAQFSDAKPVKGVKFSDVSAEHWAYEAIAIAAKMGWIEGYPDGTFRPDATITRAEMMTLVNRALERVPSDEDHLLSKRVMLTFPDCKSGDWFYIAVQEATNSHTYERAATEKNGDEQWIALRANRDWTQLEK